jgi:hypothetical protein
MKQQFLRWTVAHMLHVTLLVSQVQSRLPKETVKADHYSLNPHIHHKHHDEVPMGRKHCALYLKDHVLRNVRSNGFVTS